MRYMKTERLFFKRLKVVSENYLLNINDSEMTKFLKAGLKKWTKADLAEYIKDKEAQCDLLIGVYSINENTHIGNVLLSKISETDRTAEVGVFIFKEFSDSGYGSESTEALINFAFQKLNLRKLKLGVLVSHTVANKLYKKVGFKEEGILEKEWLLKECYHDIKLMAIFRSNLDIKDEIK